MVMRLTGRIVYKGGASGTVTPPANAILMLIVVHAHAAAATVSIGGGDNIPIIADAAPTAIPFADDNYSNPGAIVFTNTDSYTVVYKVVPV